MNKTTYSIIGWHDDENNHSGLSEKECLALLLKFDDPSSFTVQEWDGDGDDEELCDDMNGEEWIDEVVERVSK